MIISLLIAIKTTRFFLGCFIRPSNYARSGCMYFKRFWTYSAFLLSAMTSSIFLPGMIYCDFHVVVTHTVQWGWIQIEADGEFGQNQETRKLKRLTNLGNRRPKSKRHFGGHKCTERRDFSQRRWFPTYIMHYTLVEIIGSASISNHLYKSGIWNTLNLHISLSNKVQVKGCYTPGRNASFWAISSPKS